jgi:serine/threonine protein kinase
VKVADFGLSEDLSLPSERHSAGTMVYAAPEIYTCSERVTAKADIWSFGILIFAMFTGRIPWEEGSESDVQKQILNCSLRCKSLLPRDALALFEACVQLDPAARPTARELLETSWLGTERHIVKLASSPIVKSSPMKVDVRGRRFSEVGKTLVTDIRKGESGPIRSVSGVTLNRKYDSGDELYHEMPVRFRRVELSGSV